MKKISLLLITISTVGQHAFSQLPKIFLTKPEKMVEIKQMVKNNDQLVKEGYRTITSDADKLLNKKPTSVMDKDAMPPTGNKHDYMSMGRYYWPDPSKPDGLPYIQKDGQANPANNKITDHKFLVAMVDDVKLLSWAYYLSDNEKYAKKCEEMLRTWFLDSATYMRPNLECAQGITGKNNGTNFGIIEGHTLSEVVDAIGLLHGAKSWTTDDQKGMENWFTGYLHWLTTSKLGKMEGAGKNNHASWYDTQVVCYSLFLGDKDAAKALLNKNLDRWKLQIEPDGRQPLELKRTIAFTYSTFNLQALFILARLGEKAGVDLWSYTTPDGGNIKKALDFMLPYVIEDKKWEYPQIDNKIVKDAYYALLMEASEKLINPEYLKEAKDLKRNINVTPFDKLLYANK